MEYNPASYFSQFIMVYYGWVDMLRIFSNVCLTTTNIKYFMQVCICAACTVLVNPHTND